ncbi:MAG: hypothetical protein WC645_08140 [Candidatus Margulisiibacteriota bacterium]
MKSALRIFCLLFAACSPPVADKLPPEVTDPDYSNLCDPEQSPQEKIELKFYWAASINVSRSAFAEACKYFKDLGVTCAEVKNSSEADIWIFSSGYFSCDKNARIEKPVRSSERVQLVLNETCMPQNYEARDWQREVFAKKIGELLGVTPYPAFCGDGNFANYVDRWWFREPYDDELTASDEIAWYHRDRSASAFGSNEPAPYCGPDTDPVPAICAAPTDINDAFVVNIYARPDIWTEALYACNMWATFGVTCLSTDEESADVVVAKNRPDDCATPGKTEFNFTRSQWVVNISGCLNGPSATVRITHQLGHMFGLPHIPDWCAAGIMNESPGADCLTWADYGVWRERAPNTFSTYE